MAGAPAPSARQGFLAGITRNIVLLGFVSLFTDLSSQAVFPLLPLFMTSVLGAGAVAVGAVEGAAETTASLLKVASGYWSDGVRRRKHFVLLGYSLSALTKPLFALASAWPFVLVVRIVERIGKGVRDAPRDAIVAESCAPEVRGKAYGFHRAMDGTGSLLGALAAALLLPLLGYRKLFLVAFLPGILAVGAILPVKDAPAPEEKGEKQRISILRLPGALKLFLLIAGLFSLGHFGYAFLLLKAKGIGLADTSALWLYILYYAVYSLCSTPLGMLSDRIGRKPLLLGSYLLFGAAALALLFSSTPVHLIAAFALYGVFFAMNDGSQRAFAVDLAPKEMRATALGALHTATGIAALPGGLIAGLLWESIGPQATFLYGAVLAALTALLFIVFVVVRKSHEPAAS